MRIVTVFSVSYVSQWAILTSTGVDAWNLFINRCCFMPGCLFRFCSFLSDELKWRKSVIFSLCCDNLKHGWSYLLPWVSAKTVWGSSWLHMMIVQNVIEWYNVVIEDVTAPLMFLYYVSLLKLHMYSSLLLLAAVLRNTFSLLLLLRP